MIRKTNAPALVAIVATVLMLGLPLMGTSTGREVRARVFIVATIVLLAFAVSTHVRPQRARALLTGALVTLGATLVLALNNIAVTGTILLGIAIGGAWYQRRLLDNRLSHSR